MNNETTKDQIERSDEDRRKLAEDDRRKGEQQTVKKLFHDYEFEEERTKDDRRNIPDRREH